MALFSFPSTPPPADVLLSDWQDWTWQLRNSLKNEAQYSRYFQLTENERSAFQQGKELFNIRTTPYYAVLAGATEQDPLRKILMPHRFELEEGLQQMPDPLGEVKNLVAKRVVHRYSDRVLFLVTDICSVYCRFCTRKHFTGSDQALIKPDEYEQALSYIQRHPGIREVILSGGDPLTLSDSQLDRILFDLRKIPHLEIIRLGTRMPVVAPQRVTEDLVKILRRRKPVFLMTHFNHPRELTHESAAAVEMFVDHGVPVMNQLVLLNGINNHEAVIQALSRRLLFLRAKPYYMFQCDPSLGTDHLRTSIDDSLQIQKELWGHLSGLAMPNFSVDIPKGGGKTSLVPNFQIESSATKRRFKGWDGVEADYVNPDSEKIIKPLDAEVYMDEWMRLKDAKLSPALHT